MDGVDFGRTDVMYYQAIGVTPLLVLLLTFAGVRGLQVGVVVLGVAALATAVVVWPDSRDAGVCVVVGVIPAIGLSLGWLGFHRLVRSLVEKTESERASLWRAQREAAARIEVEAARRRWRGAALSAALDLLGGVSSQQLDPSDPDVQHRCADEEEYLRQLILLSPDSYRMNAWFARSLAESRSRGVRFVVRGGDADVRDDDSAQLLGQTIIAAVSASPPGTAVTAGLYPADGGVRLVLVGERGSLAPVAEPADIAAAGMRVDFSAVGEQDVLEISPADDGESCLA